MKHWQEVEIEFKRKIDVEVHCIKYPDLRGIIVRLYGGTVEESIKRAREQLRLEDDWQVVRAEGADR